jgi:hypothetical protein
MRIAMRALSVLLCVVLLCVGCAPAATVTIGPTPTPPAWMLEEAAYLNAVLPSLTQGPNTFAHLIKQPPNPPTARADATQLLEALRARPPAPATLAAVEYLTTHVISACNTALTMSGSSTIGNVTYCVDQFDAVLLELARLYAARGAYPPGYLP